MRLTSGSSPSNRSSGALTLSAHIQPGMDTLEVPVETAGVRTVSASNWQSDKLDATAFTMIGFVWSTASPQAPRVQVRTRREGQWSRWWPLPTAHEPPTGSGARASDHTGTELVWVGISDGVQFDIRGAIAPDMKLVLLYPRPLPSDSEVPEVGPAGAGLPTTLVEGTDNATQRLRPTFLSRATWGADESWRDGAPRYNQVFQQVHVHHTASRNDYSRADVPALIRGMYSYHTRNLGWSDLAYNFLVDRFGRVWEGRAGGVARRVRGAHTLGFNATSAGIAVIGNFDIGTPGTRITDAVASVAAWKLSRWSGDPLGKVRVVSEGSDRFAAGRTVTLPVIDGHRDTNETACPGSHLYALLPQIRQRARELIDDAAKTLIGVLEPAIVTGTVEVGRRLIVNPGRYDAPDATVAYVWMRNGVALADATSATYTCAPGDFGARLSVSVTAAAPDRLPVTQVLPIAGLVRAQPVVRVTVKTIRRRARITVTVHAPAGVQTVPAGRVVVQLGQRETVAGLADGVAIVRFRGMRAGEKRGVVTYTSGNGFNAASANFAATIEVS